MNNLTRALAVLMAVLTITVLATPIVAGPATAADGDEDAVTLPADIPINSDAAVSEYEENGVVKRNVSAPNMEITIGTERDHVGLDMTLDPLEGSTRNDFIRVENNEEIGRTVQIPIRADYWKPFPRDGLESMDGEHTATLEPVTLDGETYTMLTVTFEGQGSAVFPVPEDAVAVYSSAQRTENRTNETFGISLGLTSTPWQKLPEGVLSGNETTVRIEGDPQTMMIQYNAGTANDPLWLNVPEGPKRGKPVYRMKKDGVDNAVYVVTKTSDPPQIRYKKQATTADEVSEWIRGARQLPKNIEDGLGIDLPFTTLTPHRTVSTFGGVPHGV